jgi:hypothetical protein
MSEFLVIAGSQPGEIFSPLRKKPLANQRPGVGKLTMNLIDLARLRGELRIMP